MKIVISLFFVIFASLPNICTAMERFDIVTTGELVQMLEAREKGETDFILVNTLDEILARNMSIPGSISAPWSRIDKVHSRLGEKMDRLIVTYCMGYR